jgi:hypothetical protein
MQLRAADPSSDGKLDFEAFLEVMTKVRGINL